MNHLLKRSLSLIVAVVMVLAMIPANPVHVHAEEVSTIAEAPLQMDLYGKSSGTQSEKIDGIWTYYDSVTDMTLALKNTSGASQKWQLTMSLEKADGTVLLVETSVAKSTVENGKTYTTLLTDTHKNTLQNYLTANGNGQYVLKAKVYDNANGNKGVAAKNFNFIFTTESVFLDLNGQKEAIEVPYGVALNLKVGVNNKGAAKNLVATGTVTSDNMAEANTFSIASAKLNNGYTSVPVAPDKLGACAEAGTYNFTVTIKDGANNTLVEKTFVITRAACTHEYDDVCDTICNVCEAVRTAVHQYGEGVETKTPNCTEKGEMSYTCDLCGDVKTQILDEKHNIKHYDANEATCLKEGNLEGYMCKDCGKCWNMDHLEVERESMFIEKLKHQPSAEWKTNSTHHGKVCINGCNAVLEKYEHTFDLNDEGKGACTTCGYGCPHKEEDREVKIVDPTCTEYGKKITTCKACGESKTENTTPELGHDIVPVKDGDADTHRQYCQRCQKEGNRAAHEWVAGETVAPSVGEQGYTKYSCKCGATKQGDFTDALSPVAKIDETGYATLQAAIDAAAENDTITLVADIELTESVVIPAGKTITLNLNGKTISTHIAEKLTKSFCMIQNKGTLTITDSVGTGKISVSYGGESFGYGVGLYAISNEGGVLTIAGGTVENLATVTGSMYDAIDNNSTLGETVLNITGGTVSCPNYIAIRQFANSTGAKNIVNVEGGTIIGGNTSVWMQNPGSSNPLGELNITNGTVNGRLLLGSSSEFDAAVSGGTFDTDVSAFCAEDYKVKQNGDGTYSVIEKALEGSGTAEAPYLISSVEDFIFFAKQVQSGNSYSGKIVKLANDIDFNGANFLEIAEDGTIVTDYRLSNFSGTFDGDNYTIKNFNFEVKCAYKGYIMMFSSNGGYEIIRNLKIENVTVNVADITGQTRITALANLLNVGGKACAAVENVHIKNYTINCTNTTSSDLRIGGFAYFAQGSQLVAQDCSIEDFTVNANSATILGGAVSIVKSKCDFINVDVIDAKFNIGNMTNVAGGFAGQTQDNGTGTTFTDCDVDVEMTFGTIATDIGGFVASIGAASQFYNCTTSGSITVTGEANGKSVGGFVGDLGWNGMGAPNTQHEFNNCVADVDITAVNANVGGFIGNSTVEGYPERFIPAYFNNCEAKGDVKTVNGVAGGFAGHGDRGIFNDCSASGNVEGRIAGGFWGEIYPKAKAESLGGWGYDKKEVTHTDANAKSIVLDSVAATGAVEGTEYEAGIIGFMKDVYVNADETLGYATPIVLNETPAEFNRYEYPAKKYEVSTKAELNAALAEAQEGEIILLTADIDYGTDQLKIEKAITLDLGGNTLTTRNAWGGMIVTNNPTIKNGTIVHASNTAAIKVWNATAFEDLTINVQGKGDANKTIGGIVLQSGSTTNVGSIKNVTIKGEALTNGIQTYNCGDAAKNVIGSLEKVTIDAKGTGMLISAPVGTATNCSISGDVNGVEIWIKGNYNATLTLVNSSVEGGVYAHDEFSTNPDVVNNGTLKLTVDETTTGADAEDVTLTIARAEDVQGVLKDVMDKAQAKIGNTYYLTLEAAVAAAQNGETIVLVADIALTEGVVIPAGKTITLDLAGKTISQEKACTESYSMITNNGNLTIQGNGKISFTDTGAGDSAASWGSYTITNNGTLVVENGTIENLSAQNQAGQPFAHVSLAIFQYSGSTTINGGTISTPNYRSVRLWKGDMTITGGEFVGQVWVQSVDNSAKLTITGGSFRPVWNDGSSVFVGNVDDKGTLYEVTFQVTGGNFATKIGANNAAALNGPITGGTFTAAAANNTNAALLGENMKFVENEDGSYGVSAVIEIYEWEDLKELDALVEAGNMLEGVTVKLMNDIDLYAVHENGERVTFNPIGANTKYFKGTFDGQGYTIKNMYQSGWDLGYDWDNYGTIGLFAYVWNATIKNVTIENAECQIEGGNVAGIAGCAWGDCTFENITIKNSTFATYNNRAGGIVGYTGGEGTMTFKGITVDGDTVIAGLWGSFDSSLGGVMGSIQDPTKIVFEDVNVACRLDAYNDVTAAYKYYAYRMCGMLIGKIPVDGNNQPILDNVTIGENVVIDYSNTPDYTYTDATGSWKRVEAGYTYGGIDMTQYPDATVIYKPFNSMFGGQQYGSYGQDDHEEIEALGRVAEFDGEYFTSLENAAKAADGAKNAEGENLTVKLMADSNLNIVISDSLKLDLNGYSFTGTVTTNETGYKVDYVDGKYQVVEKPLEGSGTVADPYVIDSLEDLIIFRNSVNAGNDYAGKIVVLTSDINMTGVVWTPIGSSNYDKAPADAKKFAGIFDGGNHTITGLSSVGYVPAAEDTGSTEYSFGLFGYVYGADIKNVKFADVNIECGTRTNSAGNEVYGSGNAALIGYYVPVDGKVSVIDNCHVLSGTISASNNMGGLIGHFDSQAMQPAVDVTISNCSNAATVTAEARDAGGILGLINGTREGNDLVVMRGSITFKNCVNTGAVTTLGGGSTCAGGILGRDNAAFTGQRLKVIFDNCSNSGTITVHANGETHVAGLGTAFYSHGSWIVVKDSKNTGNIVVINPNNETYAGGLVAYAGVIDLINSTTTGNYGPVGDVNKILFLEKMAGYNDTISGNTYHLNGGTSPEYAALVDDAAGGGNFHLVEIAYKEDAEFLGWYTNPELTGEAVTALVNGQKHYYAKWSLPLEGSGTEADPYQIGSVEDLIIFRDSVNAGETFFNAPGVYVALVENIDMNGATWNRGIGDGINATFDGIFDGKNHTISNLNLAPVADSDKYFCGGLFGYTNGAVEIKNLVLDNINVTANGEGHNVGILVGFANNNGGKLNVSNVTVKNSSITAPDAYGVGAIVGYSYRAMGTIADCAVENTTISGHRFVGGITGYSFTDAVITGCTVTDSEISGKIGVGGIAGLAHINNWVDGNTVASTIVNAPKNWGYVIGELSAKDNFTLGQNNAAEPQVGGIWGSDETFVAKVNGTYYTNFAEAWNVANNGGTITLLQNYDTSILYVLNGVTLDLNSFICTAPYVVVFNGGNIVDNSASNAGRLVTTNMMINKENAQLPVNTAEGYMFVDVTFSQGWSENDYYIALVKAEPTAHELLKADLAAAGVSVYFHVSWTNSNGLERSQDFECGQTLFAQYLDNYKPETGKYGKQLELKLTGVAEGMQLTYQVVVKSNTGAEFTSGAYSHIHD